jgi:hypothetical protein
VSPYEARMGERVGERGGQCQPGDLTRCIRVTTRECVRLVSVNRGRVRVE